MKLMTQTLEDLHGAWHIACESKIDETVLRWSTQDRKTKKSFPDMSMDLLIRIWATETLVPYCIDWLRQRLNNGDAVSEEIATLRADSIAVLLDRLPRCPTVESCPETRVSTLSWAITAAFGAAVGMFALTPLSLLFLGTREAGLFVGAIAGSAAAVGLIGMLANRTSVRKSLGLVATAGSLLSVMNLVRNLHRGRASIRSTFGFAAVKAITRLSEGSKGPRTEWQPPEVREAILRAHLSRIADLVLAWCWSQTVLEKSAMKSVAAPCRELHLRGHALVGIAELKMERCTDRNDPNVLGAMVDEFLETLESDGLTWETIQGIVPYRNELRERFNGIFLPGRCVKMRRPAAIYQGQVLMKGELRKGSRGVAADSIPDR